MPDRPSAKRVEELRLEYPLTQDSLVLDVGAHRGTFTAAIRQKYQCKVIAYEPIERDAALLTERFKYDSNIIVRPYGLADQDTIAIFGLDGDMSGLYASTRERTKVTLKDVSTEIGNLHITLMKLNIEGGEYAVLERLLHTGQIAQVDHIQVQFHCLREDHEPRHDAIRNTLTTTHSCTWRVPWTWESWSRST